MTFDPNWIWIALGAVAFALSRIRRSAAGERTSERTLRVRLDAENLPADVFSRPDLVFDLNTLTLPPNGQPFVDDPATELDGIVARLFPGRQAHDDGAGRGHGVIGHAAIADELIDDLAYGSQPRRPERLGGTDQSWIDALHRRLTRRPDRRIEVRAVLQERALDRHRALVVEP